MIAPAPSKPDQPGAGKRWRDWHASILACKRCVESGHIPEAAPIFQGRPGQRLMLIGQAPGVMELGPRKPFAARSGRELERWMLRAGFRDDNHFRSLTYVSSVTKCFPGKSLAGSGDRRPSPVEVAHCLPWLQGQLELQQPRLILLTGTLGISVYLPKRPLEDLIGRLFDTFGREVGPRSRAPYPWLLPLPHPSGASRWLNDPAHRDQLDRALKLLARTWPRLID